VETSTTKHVPIEEGLEMGSANDLTSL
jgi:hypothetical protein